MTGWFKTFCDTQGNGKNFSLRKNKLISQKKRFWVEMGATFLALRGLKGNVTGVGWGRRGTLRPRPHKGHKKGGPGGGGFYILLVLWGSGGGNPGPRLRAYSERISEINFFAKPEPGGGGDNRTRPAGDPSGNFLPSVFWKAKNQETFLPARLNLELGGKNGLLFGPPQMVLWSRGPLRLGKRKLLRVGDCAVFSCIPMYSGPLLEGPIGSCAPGARMDLFTGGAGARFFAILH